MKKSTVGNGTLKKHFVTFLSPGTFVAEDTTKEIESWDPERAKKLAGDIEERHGATPYGFYFTTRRRGPKDFNSKEVKKSHMFFLKGKIHTLERLVALNDDKYSVLISNMKSNKWDRVFESCCGYKWFQPLGEQDVVLEVVE